MCCFLAILLYFLCLSMESNEERMVIVGHLDLLSESKGSSGIGGSSSPGSSLKYLSGSRRNAGWFTSGSSFKFLRLKALKVPSNSKVQGRRREKAQWMSLALWNDLMCFQIHFLKFTRLITQLVQLQWLPHPLSTAENKPRVLSVQRTKRNQGFLFVYFPFCVFSTTFPWKWLFYSLGKASIPLFYLQENYILCEMEYIFQWFFFEQNI